MSRNKNEPNEVTKVDSYQFAVLRYVHDVSTQEFVNIGLVLWTPHTGKLSFEVSKHYGRLSKFFQNFDGDGYRQLVGNLTGCIKSVSAGLDNHELFVAPPRTIEDLLPKLLPYDDSCFQWSHVMSGITEDPERRFNQLFHDFVLRNEPESPRELRDEGTIWRYVFERISSLGLATRVQRNVPIITPRYSYEFKMGWMNGRQQVLEPVSFDLSDSENIKEKANRWVGRLHTLSKNNDFRMTAVITGPRNPLMGKAFEDGCGILQDSPCIRKLVPESEVDDFINEVRPEIN